MAIISSWTALLPLLACLPPARPFAPPPARIAPPSTAAASASAKASPSLLRGPFPFPPLAAAPSSPSSSAAAFADAAAATDSASIDDDADDDDPYPGGPRLGAWLPLGSASSLTGITPVRIRLCGLDLAVWHRPLPEGAKRGEAAEEWSAMIDACPHRLAPLSQGRVDPDSGCIECPYHGWGEPFVERMSRGSRSLGGSLSRSFSWPPFAPFFSFLVAGRSFRTDAPSSSFVSSLAHAAFDADGSLRALPQLDEGWTLDAAGGDAGGGVGAGDATSLPVHAAGDLLFAFLPAEVTGESWP